MRHVHETLAHMVAKADPKRPRTHFLDFVDGRFHSWAARVTMDDKTPEFFKKAVNVWYEVYTRFFRA